MRSHPDDLNAGALAELREKLVEASRRIILAPMPGHDDVPDLVDLRALLDAGGVVLEDDLGADHVARVRVEQLESPDLRLQLLHLRSRREHLLARQRLQCPHEISILLNGRQCGFDVRRRRCVFGLERPQFLADLASDGDEPFDRLACGADHLVMDADRPTRLADLLQVDLGRLGIEKRRHGLELTQLLENAHCKPLF